MSNLFHKDVPVAFVHQVFEMMRRANWHTFQVLTKRSQRVLDLDPLLLWAPNVWMGVSVESQDYLFRIEHLRRTRAHVKFLSLEPLLGPLPKIDLRGIDWVIVGGESGPRARALESAWAIEIRDQCLEAGVPFFFKQWGGRRKSSTGRLLEGRSWTRCPAEPTGPACSAEMGSVNRDLYLPIR